MGYPEMPLGPKIMLKQEKVRNCDVAWHSVRLSEFFSEFTTFGITHVHVKIDVFFLQILKGLSID